MLKPWLNEGAKNKKSHEGLGSNKKNQILDDTKLLSIVCVCYSGIMAV